MLELGSYGDAGDTLIAMAKAQATRLALGKKG